MSEKSTTILHDVKELRDYFQYISDRAGTVYESRVSGLIIEKLEEIIKKHDSTENIPDVKK